MKITLVTRFYPPDTGGGGIAAYARYAALGFVKAGHQVRVISAKAANSKERQILDNVEVIRISHPFSSYYWTRLPLLGRHARFVNDLFYAWRVRQVLLSESQKFQPDIVEYADIDAESFFHPRSLCPYVVKLHAPHKVIDPYYSPKEIPYARRGIEWIEKMAIRAAQGVSSPSRYLAGEVSKLTGIEAGAIQYVPNFIDVNEFSPVRQMSEERVVLYVGRLEPLKGASIFAMAIPAIAKEVPQARFVFLGADRISEDGTSQKTKMKVFFAQENLKERVEFHGHNTPEVFLSHYRKASAFVLPSLFENSPYTLLEAMSCAKACVVSRAGGMPEMFIDGKSGLSFEAGNSADLAEKVVALLKRASLRKRLGQEARYHVEREYSLGIGAEKTLVFYRGVISKKHI